MGDRASNGLVIQIERPARFFVRGIPQVQSAIGNYLILFLREANKCTLSNVIKIVIQNPLCLFFETALRWAGLEIILPFSTVVVFRGSVSSQES